MIFKFKIDENLPVEAAGVLTGAGHDALTVHDQRLSGYSDTALARICRHEKRAIITLDMNFADIRAYPPREYSGIIVLRLGYQDKIHVLDVLYRILPLLDKEPLRQRLWIVEENDRVRIRE